MARYVLNDDLSLAGADQLRVVEGELNKMLKQIYAANPQLVEYQPLKITASSADGSYDPPTTTHRKLGRMIAELGRALNLNLVPPPYVPDALFGRETIRQLNRITAILYGEQDDDDYAVFTISDKVVKVEGDAGRTGFGYTVTRSERLDQDQTVDWRVGGSGENEAEPSDFEGGMYPSGTILFPKGATAALITVWVKGDVEKEPDEDFFVQILNPLPFGTFRKAVSGGTIQNDEATQLPAPMATYSLSTSIVQNEGNSGTTAYTYKVYRTGRTDNSSTIRWGTKADVLSQNPASATDFFNSQFPTGTLLFEPGETEKNLIVLVQGDATVEASEDFVVFIYEPSPSANISRPEAGGKINNDDVVVEPTPQPGAAPSPNVLSVNTRAAEKLNSDLLFDSGAFGQYIRYVHTGACENAIYMLGDAGMNSYVRLGLFGNAHTTPQMVIDGKIVQDMGVFHHAPVAGDVYEITYDTKARVLRLVINGQSVYNFGVPSAIADTLVSREARFIKFFRNGYIQAGNEPTVTLSGGNITPLIVRASDLDSDGYAYWDLEYVGSPRGYGFSVEDQTGTLVKAFEPAEVVSNPEPGKVRVRAKSRVATLGVGFNYIMSEFDAGVNPIGQKITMRRTRLKRGSIGANVASMNIPYRGTRVYTNMFRQCEIRSPANNWSYVSAGEAPDLVDNLGNPIVGGKLMYTCHGPDVGGSSVLEFSIESGEMPTIRFVSMGGLNSFGPITYNGNTARVTCTTNSDQMVASGEGNFMIGVEIATLNEANPPKGLFLCEVGDDKTKTFVKKYVDRQSLLNGPMRHMDNVQANEPGRYYDRPNWNNRARRNVLGAQRHVIPLEDLVELSVACNRPIWLNISHGLCYSPEGKDYIERMLKLVFNGVGGDLNYGVSRKLRHKVEMGNENWNSGLGNWGFLAYRAREAGRATYTDGNGAQTQGASIIERVYQYNETMKLVMATIPDWADRFDRVWGLQMGAGDIFGNLDPMPSFQESIPMIDRFALAPYLPGDPNASDNPATQPASHSPEDVVTWLRSTLAAKLADVSDIIQKLLNKYGIPTDLYEWNIAFPAIYNRTAAEERAIKSSTVFYNFMKDEYIAGIVPIGGDGCIYSDDGKPAGGTNPNFSQSWYFFEGNFNGAGNKSWLALIDYASANGYPPNPA